jgi:hypothetical protein
MSQLNVRAHSTPVFTHEGAPASPHLKPIEQLRRSTMACLLWEQQFYESGMGIATRVANLIPQCQPWEVAELAIQCREQQKLRHMPLLIVRELARDAKRCPDGLIAATLERIIQRADELTEFLALYWKDGKKPISAQVKKGLARAFCKFDEYKLAKYNRDGAIKLKDVLFMVRAKPQGEEQAALWKRLVDGTLVTPDTWEVALSGGADKKETFTRLIQEGKLGYMALLRNLRNMQGAGVGLEVVAPALLSGAIKSKALPFRFVAAARACPSWESTIDEAMMKAFGGLDKLPGKTNVLVDVSGSMDAPLSAKSDLSRIDAACALAVLARGVGQEVRVFSFSNDVVEVPPRNGMALIDAVQRSQSHAETQLGQALHMLPPGADRTIIITDEQSQDLVVYDKNKLGKGYIVNVASAQNGVAYDSCTHINGWSESVVQFIVGMEKGLAQA